MIVVRDKKLSVVSDRPAARYSQVKSVSDRNIALVAVGDRQHTGVVRDYAELDYAELSNIIRLIHKKQGR